MIFDAHTHVFPDKLAGKALHNLSEICGQPYHSDGTVDGTLRVLKEWGVDGALCLHIATKPKQQASVNHFAAEVQKRGLLCFGSVHPDAPDALDELARIRSLGLRGVKFHPDYQGFFADDPKAFPIYAAAEELGLPVAFHTGWDPLSPDVVHAPPQAVAKVAEEFPKLTVIAAHMGGMARSAEAEEYLAGRPNVYFDTAVASLYTSPEEMLRLIRKHGPDRILFGSDCPWSRSVDELHFLQALPLTSAEMESILYGNAARLFGLHS